MQKSMEYCGNNKVVTRPKTQYLKLTVTFIKIPLKKKVSVNTVISEIRNYY